MLSSQEQCPIPCRRHYSSNTPLSLVSPSTITCTDGAHLMLRDAQEWMPETLAVMTLKSPTCLLPHSPNNTFRMPPFSHCSPPNQSHRQVPLIGGIQATHLYPCCKGIWESQLSASTWGRETHKTGCLRTLEECSKGAG